MKRKIAMKEYIGVPGKDLYASAEHFREYVDQFDEDESYPYGFITNTAVWKDMNIVDYYSGKAIKTVSFVTNNYLGMTQHPEVKKAAMEAIRQYGIGTCAASPIGGYMEVHRELEEKLARLHDKERAILFTSGYAANIGVFQNMFDKSDLVIVDMLVHASIFDGLGNNTNVKMYKHNDMEYLEMVLKREQGKYRNIVIVVDGVFSQDGDLANLPVICELAQQYRAFVFVDDAHGVGVLGKNGKGTADHFGVADKVDLVIGTFSKSMGSTGGYIAGSDKLVNYIRHFSRSNTFSAALAPAVVAGAAKAIDLFMNDSQYIDRLWQNTSYLKQRLRREGFDIGQSVTPITPLMVRDDDKTLFTARKLLENGIYVVPAVYPAVKIKDSRFRVNVTAAHERADLDLFCDVLIDTNKKYNLQLINKVTRTCLI